MPDEELIAPAGWDVLPLIELLESLESGSRPPGGVRGISHGVPSVGGEHLNADGGFDFEAVKYVPEEFYADMRRGHIRRGDVLVVKDGATTGKVSIVGNDFPFEHAVVNEHVFVCRPASVEAEYLFWFLYSHEGQRRILEHFRGSAQGGITQSFARDTFVPVPPAAEQQRIAGLLADFAEQSASARFHLRTARRAIVRLRQAVLAAACSGRLTDAWRAQADVEPAAVVVAAKRRSNRERLGKKYREPRLPDVGVLPSIPASWGWAMLPELGDLGRGKSKHRPRNDTKLYGGPYPFIQTGDVAQSDGRIVSFRQTYNEAGLAQSRLWPERTVCITIAANIADSALLSFPACFPDSVVGLVADEAVALPEYVELFVRTARRDLAAFAPATAQANINLAILSELAIAIPPIDEQREIVRRVDELYDLCAAIGTAIEAATTRVGRSSEAVLAKAFRGELVS